MSRLDKMERLAMSYGMSYGMSASAFGTMIHDDLLRNAGAPVKTKKPWQKGFIPTVGKKPELPAPVLGGEWQFRERNGNMVEYQLRSEDPFSWGWPRIKGDLLKRQWAVTVTRKENQVHDASYYQEQTLFTSHSHKACVVFVALDPDLTTPVKPLGIDFGAAMFKTQTGRFAAMSPAPQLQQLPKIQVVSTPVRPRDHQLEYYRGLMADYCQKDMVVFDERHVFKRKLAELDKADDESV